MYKMVPKLENKNLNINYCFIRAINPSDKSVIKLNLISVSEAYNKNDFNKKDE